MTRRSDSFPVAPKFGGGAMPFEQALGRLKAGAAMRRECWSDPEFIVLVARNQSAPLHTVGTFDLFNPDEEWTHLSWFAGINGDSAVEVWTPSITDLLASDWIEVEP